MQSGTVSPAECRCDHVPQPGRTARGISRSLAEYFIAGVSPRSRALPCDPLAEDCDALLQTMPWRACSAARENVIRAGFYPVRRHRADPPGTFPRATGDRGRTGLGCPAALGTLPAEKENRELVSNAYLVTPDSRSAALSAAPRTLRRDGALSALAPQLKSLGWSPRTIPAPASPMLAGSRPSSTGGRRPLDPLPGTHR